MTSHLSLESRRFLILILGPQFYTAEGFELFQETKFNMSNQQSTFQSFSFSSSSFSSSSNGEPPKTTRHSEMTYSNPDGTTTKRTSELPGQQTTEETTYTPSGSRIAQADTTGRIEDVTEATDADRQYEERMEDEYAKREGGA